MLTIRTQKTPQIQTDFPFSTVTTLCVVGGKRSSKPISHPRTSETQSAMLNSSSSPAQRSTVSRRHDSARHVMVLPPSMRSSCITRAAATNGGPLNQLEQLRKMSCKRDTGRSGRGGPVDIALQMPPKFVTINCMSSQTTLVFEQPYF